jgi:hypothetical protein
MAPFRNRFKLPFKNLQIFTMNDNLLNLQTKRASRFKSPISKDPRQIMEIFKQRIYFVEDYLCYLLLEFVSLRKILELLICS